jgi:hypothetical protein
MGEKHALTRLMLVASAVALLANSLTLAWDFSQHSVQMDLSAFYGAGESLRLGLDPYRNNYPAVVTGTDFMRYSGFLYPPLTGLLFKALAALPYDKFKMLWDFSQPVWALACGAVLLAWLRRSGRAAAAPWGVALFYLALSVAFPLRMEMDRGQVDLMLLLLLLSGLVLVEVYERGVAGGLLLGLAPLLKLHALYLLPFLLIRRRWSALAGSAIALAAIVAAHLLVVPSLSKAYVFDVLPRMDGSSVERPAEWIHVTERDWADMSRPSWDQVVQRSGRSYRREGLDTELTVANASLARQLYEDVPILKRVGRSRLSIGIFAGCFLLAFAAVRRRPHPWSGTTTLAFWMMAIGVVLLSAPLTWTMATVTLLPAAALAPSWIEDQEWPHRRRALIMLFAGLLLVVLDTRVVYHEVDRNVSGGVLGVLHYAAVFCLRVQPILSGVLIAAALATHLRWAPADPRVAGAARPGA